MSFNTFETICKSGNVDKFKKFMNENPTFNPLYLNNIAFIRMCENGNLELAKYLYEKYKFDLRTDDDFYFRFVCSYGQLDFVKWLTRECPEIYIWAKSRDAFRCAARYGHINILEWFENKKDTRSNDDYAFIIACCYGNLNSAKWLFENCEINIHSNLEEPFRKACFNGHTEIVEWLYDLEGRVNLHVLDDWVFKAATKTDNDKLSKWLDERSKYNCYIR